jgi:hypothetical protein
MSDSISSVRREIAHTRERMTETIDEIDSEISERVNAVKRRVDVVQWAREHPWPALGVAVAIGAAIGGSGADEKAAAATATAAKRAASATSDAAKNLVAKVKERRRSSKADRFMNEESTAVESGPGFGDRLFAAASAPLVGVIERILDEMRAASRDMGARLARSGGRRRMAPVSTVTEVDVVVAVPRAPANPLVPRAEDVVPVPKEMLPTELDARADAVEAMGGGTHEPPLEPGAGDLGARWA